MKVGMGVIGVGTWGRQHAQVYATHPQAQLVAVCDRDEKRAKKVAKEFGARKVFTDYRELLTDPEVQAVSIATPDFAHVKPVECAARAGKHILLEKPLATTVRDAKRIARVVQQTGIKLMLDFHNRWNPPFYTVKKTVESGEIGIPISAYIHLHDTLFVPTRMLTWAAQSSPLWFLGSHCLDVLRWMLSDEVECVYGVSRSRVLKGMGVNTPDHYSTILQFKRGVTAVMENCWILPDTEPSIVDFRMDLICSKGAMNVDYSHSRTVQKYTRKQATYPNMLGLVEVHGRLQGFTIESIRCFVECIAEDKEPPVGVMDGLANTRVLAAIEKSVKSGRAIRL